MQHFAYATLFLLTACASTAPPPEVRQSDFDAVLGDGWRGALTYRDYSPPYGDVTLPAEMSLVASETGIETSIRYPTESHANGADTWTISSGGAVFNGDAVTSRVEQDGALIISTRAPCQDDDRSAMCEHTYLLSPHALRIEKTVTSPGEPPVRRNRYAFTR